MTMAASALTTSAKVYARNPQQPRSSQAGVTNSKSFTRKQPAHFHVNKFNIENLVEFLRRHGNASDHVSLIVMPKPPRDYGPISIARDLDTTDKLVLTTRLTVRRGAIHDEISDDHREEFKHAARARKTWDFDEWTKQGGKNVACSTCKKDEVDCEVYARFVTCVRCLKHKRTCSRPSVFREWRARRLLDTPAFARYGGSAVAFDMFLEDLHETQRMSKQKKRIKNTPNSKKKGKGIIIIESDSGDDEYTEHYDEEEVDQQEEFLARAEKIVQDPNDIEIDELDDDEPDQDAHLSEVADTSGEGSNQEYSNCRPEDLEFKFDLSPFPEAYKVSPDTANPFSVSASNTARSEIHTAFKSDSPLTDTIPGKSTTFHHSSRSPIDPMDDIQPEYKENPATSPYKPALVEENNILRAQNAALETRCGNIQSELALHEKDSRQIIDDLARALATSSMQLSSSADTLKEIAGNPTNEFDRTTRDKLQAAAAELVQRHRETRDVMIAHNILDRLG
ncbi:hypothetical protein PLICRDRAFT_27488 [Plicaturopsis crispa FD-325 SS-3]|nr:hypothetical protein PLICRDRAFT_27488 [Plicaturopsis crispa FD-325 SS-3]